MSTPTTGSTHYAGLLPLEPLGDPPSVRPTTLENDLLPVRQPQARKRAAGSLARLLMIFCIGVAATLAWQSYGDAARKMIASLSAQFGWFASPRALNAEQAPDAIALAVSPALYPDHEQLDAVLRDLSDLRQRVNQIAASQEQVMRTIGPIIARAGQEQTMHTADQPSTSAAQAPSTSASAITVESRADGASSQPSVIKPIEAKPPQALPERKPLSVVSGHDPSCLPSASAVLQNHPGAWPQWTLNVPGHKGTVCWYAAARPIGSDLRREMMPRDKETVGITQSGVSAPPASYTRAPE
jgi:hypothetical protein